MKDRVVVVTGGGRGIGRAICQRFAADGAMVVAASRTAADLHETRELIEQAGGKCHGRPTDLSSPDEVNALINDTVAEFGSIDVLVNNAGAATVATMLDLEPAVFENLLSVNVSAVYHACRSVWPVMTRQGSGVIINISSMASVDPFPGFTAYGAAKAWVNAWTKGLANEGRPLGIRVFAVAPGAVETGMLRDAFPDFPAEQTLLPEEVADVVHTLSLPACQHATGQTVFVRK